jgi:hypothetical protein
MAHWPGHIRPGTVKRASGWSTPITGRTGDILRTVEVCRLAAVYSSGEKKNDLE